MDGDIDFLCIVSVDGDTVPRPPAATTNAYEICPTSPAIGALEYKMAISSIPGLDIDGVRMDGINLDIFDPFEVEVVVYGKPDVSAVSALVYSILHSHIQS